MSYLMLANADAGSAEHRRIEVARTALADSDQVELRSTRDTRELDRALDDLDGRTLVIVGGDGSLHVAVQRLFDRDLLDETTLGLVPAGTGNDFARSLALPEDAESAARVVATGDVHRIDLIVGDDGGVVVNAVHAGLGAEATATSSDFKEALGEIAYPLGAAIAGVRESGWRLTVTVDGERLTPDIESPVLMVAVGNGRSVGGGTRVCPDARLEDGRLDVFVTTAVGPLERVGFGRDLREGRHLERDDVAFARGEEVAIDGDPVRYNADGEISEPTAHRVFRVVPGALRFLAGPA